MRRIFKWAAAAIAISAIGLVIFAAIAFHALNSSLPATDGSATVAGLTADAEILRDRNGIPHIEAASREDALRALGFAHAQDRLWQLHVLRKVGEGRLSELFGSATVDTDIFLRTLNIEGVSRRSFESLSRETKGLLTAYSDGINAFLNRDVGFLSARLPPEFLILGKSAEPWEPWHSVAILKVMALTLDSNMADEIRRLAFARHGLSPSDIDDLMPYGPRVDPPPLPDMRDIYDFGETAARNAVRGGRPGKLAWKIGVSASNNWVVAGSRTTTGHALLANDPHLGLQSPSIFYLAHLAFDSNGERRDLAGAMIPGIPFVLAGRNDRIAWGLTTAKLDSQDLYLERLNPEDPRQYLTPQGWRTFETEAVRIEVDGGEAVDFVRRISRHGPVLPGSYADLDRILPAGHVAALQWIARADDDNSLDAIAALNMVRNVGEFLSTSRELIAPVQATVVADRDGNIALLAPGRIPIRNPGNSLAGRAPVPGWDAVFDWQGFRTSEQAPAIVNPPGGALASANANWLPRDYPYLFTLDFDEHFRQARVEEIIVAASEKHSPQTMRAAQADIYSPALAEFAANAFARLEAGANQDRDLIAELRNWDFKMRPDSPLPLIMTAWWRQTNIALFSDELGEEFTRFDRGRLRPVNDAIAESSHRDWCDDIRTERKETCGIILAKAFSEAMMELREEYGPDWRDWSWGKAHTARGEHRPFSAVSFLAKYFEVGPESAGGAYTLMRGQTDFAADEPFRNVHASVFRAWYDLGDLDKSQYVISTGQSGHFLSGHYADLADDWAQSRYIEIPTAREEYRGGIESTWILRPRS